MKRPMKRPIKRPIYGKPKLPFFQKLPPSLTRILLMGGALITLIMIIPTLLVVILGKDEPGFSAYNNNAENEADATNKMAGTRATDDSNGPIVSVYRSKLEKIEEVPFEDYIVGVVAREMPATFEMEALKAQALTARTYILNLLMFGTDMKTPDGADVTDTEDHQVFFNEEELREHWGDDFEWKMARVRQAVYETSGEVITYEGRPITATFFSTSNGYTENSEEYWENEIPYLRSVESPWDVQSPRFQGEKRFTRQEVEAALNISFQDGGINLLSRTTGGRVGKISIGGKEFTGREVRELLGLDSSDFTFQVDGDTIIVETFGWGHGVGMSQYGADGMAKEGYTYTDIIHHYYQDVEIMKADQFLGDISFVKDRLELDAAKEQYSASGKNKGKTLRIAEQIIVKKKPFILSSCDELLFFYANNLSFKAIRLIFFNLPMKPAKNILILAYLKHELEFFTMDFLLNKIYQISHF